MGLRPGPRMNTHMTMKNGILYLYGGILEQGDRSYILNDLWSIDIKKMNQWKRINKTDKVNWEGSDKGDSDDEDISEEQEHIGRNFLKIHKKTMKMMMTMMKNLLLKKK